MTDILVDSNVILDLLTEDPQWFQWSDQMLTEYANRGHLVINPIIYKRRETLAGSREHVNRYRTYFPSVQLITP